MSKNSKRVLVGITAIILVFAVFYVMAQTRDVRSEAAIAEPTVNSVTSSDNGQAPDVIEQLSQAF